MRKSNTFFSNRQPIQAKSDNLPMVLENWQRAILIFKTRYDELGKIISLRKKWMTSIIHHSTGVAGLRSIDELEQIRLQMQLELDYLLQEVSDQQGTRAQEILRLQEHTLRLQRHNQRVLRWINQ